MNMSYPYDIQKNAWSSCKVYDTNFTDAYYLSKIPANQTKNCDRWIYDKKDGKNSAVMEVYNKLWKILILSTVVWCFKLLKLLFLCLVQFSVWQSMVQRYVGLYADGRCHVGFDNIWILIRQVSNFLT